MFVNNLRYYRLKKGMTQIEFAEKLGVTNCYISQIERGVKNPGFILARKISILLEQSVDKIFYHKIEQNILKKEYAKGGIHE